MTPDREHALDRIKKLLRMKRGGTPAEIETALAIAAQIAAQHGIDLDSVNADEDQRKSELGHEEPWVARSIRQEARYAAKLVELFFNVDVVYQRRRRRWRDSFFFVDGNEVALAFVGRKFEVEIAVYIFQFLVGHFRRTWRTGRGRCRNRQSFIWGMFVGLKHKLEEQRPQPVNTNTAVVESRAAYIKEKLGEITLTKSKPPEIADTAAAQGYIAGRATELRKAMHKPGPLQLT